MHEKFDKFVRALLRQAENTKNKDKTPDNAKCARNHAALYQQAIRHRFG